MISLKLLSNFIGITLRFGCSPLNLLDIFKTAFPENTSGGLLVGLAAADKIFVIKSFLNPFVPNALFLYSLKTSENLTVF